MSGQGGGGRRVAATIRGSLPSEPQDQTREQSVVAMMSMVATVALRNLVHDKTRLAATLVGIVFSVVLVGIQLGLYIGASRMITGPIDHAEADLWVMPVHTESLEDGLPLLRQDDRSRALAVPGVASAAPLMVHFADWQRPDGAITHVVVIGSGPDGEALRPWNVTAGQWDANAPARSVVVDRTYLGDLGIKGLGDTVAIEGASARVVALSDGIRSFSQSPLVFTTLNQARAFVQAGPDRLTYLLVRTQPGVDREVVRDGLTRTLSNVEVLTPDEFSARSLDRWLMQTGAGVALIGGAILGALVGAVIVAQTLYANTNEYLKEFAMLRAIGSSSSYIFKVIIAQAIVTAVVGFVIGLAGTMVMVALSRNSPMPLVVTPQLAGALLGLTVIIAGVAAIAAIYRVTRIDPATVFAR